MRSQLLEYQRSIIDFHADRGLHESIVTLTEPLSFQIQLTTIITVEGLDSVTRIKIERYS